MTPFASSRLRPVFGEAPTGPLALWPYGPEITSTMRGDLLDGIRRQRQRRRIRRLERRAARVESKLDTAQTRLVAQGGCPPGWARDPSGRCYDPAVTISPSFGATVTRLVADQKAWEAREAAARAGLAHLVGSGGLTAADGGPGWAVAQDAPRAVEAPSLLRSLVLPLALGAIVLAVTT